MLRSVAASGPTAAGALRTARAGQRLLELACGGEAGDQAADAAVVGAMLLLRDLLDRGEATRHALSLQSLLMQSLNTLQDGF